MIVKIVIKTLSPAPVSAKLPLSVHLSGDNYIGYDLSHIGGAGQPILAER